MNSYIHDSLVDGEQLLHLSHISLWPYAHHIAGGIALLASPALTHIGWPSFLGALWLLYVFVVYESTELAITDRRVIVKRGIMSRNTSELYLNRIEGVEVVQSVTGRMLDFGTVTINGVGTEVAPVTRVKGPLEFRRAFFSAADKVVSGADGGKGGRF
jgi:uncharacterized membrane protein YdbT with pleckstrin-like domain